VLILLPPSEGKWAPARGKPVDPGRLAFAEALGEQRQAVIDALVRTAGGPLPAALEALRLSAGQADEVERDRLLMTAPAAAAAKVYTGVLYQHLDLGTLSVAGRRRAARSVLIASALWGVVSPTDRIPAYRLSADATLPGLGKLAAAWRPALRAALPDHQGDLVVDLRSSAYAAAWRPRHATLVEVRASTAGGKVISHMAKAVRGRVARRLLEAQRAPRGPEAVASLAHDDEAGAVRLHPPGARGGAWVVEVVER
jgi:cytoplasmic iron level regulating protein YaaA (DUF328/UPF0246 family)